MFGAHRLIIVVVTTAGLGSSWLVRAQAPQDTPADAPADVPVDAPADAPADPPTAAPAAISKGTWKQFDEDEGIRLWKLEVPGEQMPGFRGQTLIAAPADRILREIEKVEQHPQWMHRCAEARMIRRIDGNHAIVYNRTDTPWPVWDRDVVLDTHVERAADGKRIMMRFKNIAYRAVPVPERVVRMPRLEGSYLLETLPDGSTRVTYTVEVEIGGSIPGWVAERVAREMPFETLSRLRERVQERMNH